MLKLKFTVRSDDMKDLIVFDLIDITLSTRNKFILPLEGRTKFAPFLITSTSNESIHSLNVLLRFVFIS